MKLGKSIISSVAFAESRNLEQACHSRRRAGIFLLLSFLVVFFTLVILSACTDYVSQMEDEYENSSVYKKSVACVGPSLKKYKATSLAKESENIDVFTLDVVIRDFQQNHPDFENFSEEKIPSLQIQAESAPSRFGQPSIDEVFVNIGMDGRAYNSMFMSVPLADSSVAAIKNKNVPSMVVIRDVTVKGEVQTKVYGFYVTSMIGPIDEKLFGQMYQFSGVLKDVEGNIIDGGLLGGDRVSFNVPWSRTLEYRGNEGDYPGYPDYVWDQLMAWSHLVDFYIASVTGKHMEGFDETERWGLVSDSCDE